MDPRQQQQQPPDDEEEEAAPVKKRSALDAPDEVKLDLPQHVVRGELVPATTGGGGAEDFSGSVEKTKDDMEGGEVGEGGHSTVGVVRGSECAQSAHKRA